MSLAVIFGPGRAQSAPAPSVGTGTLEVTERAFGAATVWTLDHAIEHTPSVTVVDAAGRSLLAQIERVSATRVVVTHNSPTAGTLRID